MVFDFAAELPRAHLRSGGLLIDLGTPARHKHTLADWKSGFRGDHADGETTFSYMEGNAATLFFDALPGEEGAGRITLKARAIGSTKARIYLNGEYVGSVELPKDRMAHAEVEFAEGIAPGPNKLMLRCNRRSKAADGGQAALALDYVRIIPAATRPGPAAAAYDAPRYPDAAGGSDGLLLAAGESITYFLPVGEGMTLRGQVRARSPGGKARLEVSATTDDGKRRLLSDRELSDRNTRLALPLEGLAGETAALTVASSLGEVILGEIGLHIPVTTSIAAPGTPRAKNLVLVLIDTLRADKLSFHNRHSRVRADTLEQLARESMVFERALAPENWTKPSIASLLSGLYPDTHRTQGDRDKLPGSVVTAPKHFRSLGFETAGFVANGYVSAKFGFRDGWDTWTNYVREHKANRAQFVMDDAVAWLDGRSGDKPFFLYVHTIDPHVPYIPPRKYWTLYDSGPYRGPVQPTGTAKLLGRVKAGAVKLNARDRVRLEALYDGEITYHDDQLVRLVAALDRHGLLDDTLLVVTSDHGEEFFEHGSVGHGHSLHEELLHVPLLFRLPGAEEAEKPARATAEVSLTDVLPTACDILGVECPAEVEGRPLTGLLEGDADPRYPGASHALFLNGQRAVRMGRFKAIYKGLGAALYDLERDPIETADASAERPVTLATLRDSLGSHLGRFIRAAAPDSPRRRRADAHTPEKVVIDPETEGQLKALGYLGGE
jgi:arylsulfatase A-like enzyme